MKKNDDELWIPDDSGRRPASQKRTGSGSLTA